MKLITGAALSAAQLQQLLQSSTPFAFRYQRQLHYLRYVNNQQHFGELWVNIGARPAGGEQLRMYIAYTRLNLHKPVKTIRVFAYVLGKLVTRQIKVPDIIFEQVLNDGH